MKRQVLCALCAIMILACLICVPACAEETEVFIFDMADMLTQSEVLELNEAAEEVSLQYGCGVYIAVFEDIGKKVVIRGRSFFEGINLLKVRLLEAS